MNEPKTFLPTGALAIRADAIDMEIELTQGITMRQVGSVGIIQVRGPLYHHPVICFPAGMAADYDTLKGAVAAAFESSSAVVLSIDSPGGMASGCFDTADEIRAIADAAGKPLFAYVDGTTCSAAYAIACSADRIFVPPAGELGSVGVYGTIRDTSGAAEKSGVRFHLVGSGKAKGATAPGIPVDEEALAEARRNVEAKAGVFFDLVERRRGIPRDTVAGWEGRTFVGKEAVDLGLADAIASEDQLLAMVASGTAAEAASKEENMVDTDEALKALRAAAGEGNERAKRALAAYDSEPDGDKKDDDEPKDKAEGGGGDPGPKEAEGGGGDPGPKEPEGDEGKKALAAALKRLDALERTQVLASRPDLSTEQVKALSSVPTEALKAALSAIPRGATPVSQSLAALASTPTQGEPAKPNALRPLPREQEQAMAAAFGLTGGQKLGVVHTEYRQTFGVPVTGDK